MNIFNDETIYRLVLSDAIEVIETCFSKDEQERLLNIPDNELAFYLRRKLDIPWVEYIESSLSTLLENLEEINE